MGCVCTVPFPTSLSLTFWDNSLISPPPTHFFHVLLIKNSHLPKQIRDAFRFIFYSFCILPLDSHSSSWKCCFYPLPLHICLNPCWLRPPPSLTHRMMSSLRDQGCSTGLSGGWGRGASSLVRPRGPIGRENKSPAQLSPTPRLSPEPKRQG